MNAMEEIPIILLSRLDLNGFWIATI